MPTTPEVVRYSFSKETSFPRPLTAPRELSRINNPVKAHLKSKRHSQALEKREADHTIREAGEKAQRAARNSLLAAYSILKRSLLYLYCESSIVMRNMMGPTWGTRVTLPHRCRYSEEPLVELSWIIGQGKETCGRSNLCHPHRGQPLQIAESLT